MIVKRFFEPLIAQTSYLIGCAKSGEAVVIDPNRDVQQYIDAAARENLRIAYVTETHIHADFVSGSRELAQVTGASLCLSDEGDADWKYGFACRPLHHGDRITIGNVRLDVLHTPGHTPEHISFLITDGAVADRPIAAVTGDFVFVGDVGRPDLLEKAANMKGTMEKGARVLWASLQEFKKHEDWLQIWPGHGAGSSCGKGISAVPHSTLGYERLFNWAFQAKTEDEFVANVLAGQPDPPKYFATMKRVNKEGPAILGGFAAPKRMPDDALPALLKSGALVIDTRSTADYAAGHIAGTLNLPFGGSFVTWAGWLVPYTDDFYLIADNSPQRLIEVRRALALIGLDRVAGYFETSAVTASANGGALATVPQVTVEELARRLPANGLVVIDVRNTNEWNDGHLPGAIHIPLGYLADRVSEVPSDRPVILQCQTGNRSSIAASVLERLGRNNLSNLSGGYDALVKNVKKIFVGCLIVILIGCVGFGVAAFYAYRAARPLIDSASDYITKARELASVGDGIQIKSAYVPPVSDELTSAQVDRFVAVQSRVQLQMGNRWSELQARADAIRKKADSAKGQLSLSELTTAMSDFANLYMDARRAQVTALNVHKFSESEYDWVRNRVYEAAGIELAGAIDMSAFEKMAREGAGQSGVQVPDVPKPNIPENNRKLVKPHLAKLKESIPLAFLGL